MIGGHFAFLALGRACGGRAMEGLSFLDDVDEETLQSWSAVAKAAADEFHRPWKLHHGDDEL